MARRGRALVIGYGRSGEAACTLLSERGLRVRIADARTIGEVVAAGALARTPGEAEQAALRESWMGDRDPAALDGVDLVIKSPGVPADHPLVAAARAEGVPVFGELELGWAVAEAPLHSITGSNGKSTTTSLLAHLLVAAGVPSAPAGNIGDPLTAVGPTVPAHGAIAVEVSSFQVEDLVDYRSRVAILLNVTPDHLDRHGSLEAYRSIKARLLDLLEPQGTRIVNADDPTLEAERARWKRAEPERTLVFSSRPIGERGAYADGAALVLNLGRPMRFADVDGMSIKGPHNVQNALAAALAAAVQGADPATFAEGLRTFRPLRHRLEPVGEVQGVRFVNDSKATNLDSLLMALRSFTGRVVLIAGGRDKNSPFDDVAEEVAARVHHLVLIGEAADRIGSAWPRVPATRARSLEEAVRVGFERARPDGLVLLAPGCASFDMFKNYADRGERFSRAVGALARELSHA